MNNNNLQLFMKFDGRCMIAVVMIDNDLQRFGIIKKWLENAVKILESARKMLVLEF